MYMIYFLDIKYVEISKEKIYKTGQQLKLKTLVYAHLILYKRKKEKGRKKSERGREKNV